MVCLKKIPSRPSSTSRRVIITFFVLPSLQISSPCRTPKMDSMPINWETLDALIIDFAKSENLVEDSFSSSSPPSSPSPSSASISSSSYHSRLIIRQIRRSLEAGDIDAAIDLLRSHAPFILDDHRLLFRLQKQVLELSRVLSIADFGVSFARFWF